METVSKKKRGRPRIHDLNDLRDLKAALSPELCDRSVLEWMLGVNALNALGYRSGTQHFDPEFAWFLNVRGRMRNSLIWALGRAQNPEVIRILAREVVRLGKTGERTHSLIRRIRRWRELYEGMMAVRLVEQGGDLADTDLKAMVREVAFKAVHLPPGA